MSDKNQTIISVWNKLADLVVLSALWAVCSLPLFTMGAASAALYYALVRGVNQSSVGGCISLFFNSFRQNFKQATGFGVVFLLIAGLLGGTIWLFYTHDYGTVGSIYIFLSIALLLFVLMWCVHIFPLIGRFALSRKNVIAAANTLIHIGLGKTLLLVLLLAALEAVCVMYPPCILIAPGGYAWIAARVQEPLFHRVIRFDDPLDADPREGAD